MPLTTTRIRTAAVSDKPYKLFDGDGLYLLVNPNGGKWWRLKYRFRGKEKLLSLGTFPEVPLAKARERCRDARALISDDVDPSVNRKAQQSAQKDSAANSFEVIAREWFEKYSKGWAESHSEKIIKRLERDVFPWLGRRPISEITAQEILGVLRRIEARGANETAHRALQNCSQLLRYAVVTGRVERDPCGDLRGALSPVKGKHHASITAPEAVGGLLRAIDSYKGSLITKCALKLAPLVFVRPGELRHAEWTEIDLERGEWNIPAAKMKTREAHLVPLSLQAVAILTEVRELTGGGQYVFPGARTRKRPMSDNAILAALRRMGFAKDEMSGHGFRAMARTILDEVLHVRPDYIEHQLAHAVRDPNGRAYNRTSHLAERRDMMQRWADYLDRIKAGAEVIPLHVVAA